jgi:DNA polymerase-1
VGKYSEQKLLQNLCEELIKDKETEELHSLQQFLTSLKYYRKVKKLKDTFITGPLKAVEYNGRPVIHSDFNLDGTVTGRMSCSAYKAKEGNTPKPMGVSFHTLPKKDTATAVNIRKAYIAPPGYAFVAADYSTMELRVLAAIAGIERMKKAFREGMDLHTYSASLTFDKPMEEIDKETERQPAKITSFLIVYGGGAPNLANSVGIPLKRAEWIINRFMEIYPELPMFMDDVRRELIENQYVTTLFGRKRRLPDILSTDKKIQERAFRQGLNTLIQSPASDIMECAVLGAVREMKSKGLDSRVVAVVHDSMEVICRKDLVEEVVEIMYRHMVENPIMASLGVDLNLPLVVDFDIGNSFGDGVGVKVEGGTIISDLDEILRNVA